MHEILKTPDDYYKGYIVLHDKFKEFPPAPESLTPNIDWFSSFQKDLGVKNGIIKKNINIMDQINWFLIYRITTIMLYIIGI
ncbi:MAG: hypothetical protein ACKPKO_53465 [Candidatus Fonsibacter sp.]